MMARWLSSRGFFEVNPGKNKIVSVLFTDFVPGGVKKSANWSIFKEKICIDPSKNGGGLE